MLDKVYKCVLIGHHSIKSLDTNAECIVQIQFHVTISWNNTNSFNTFNTDSKIMSYTEDNLSITNLIAVSYQMWYKNMHLG